MPITLDREEAIQILEEIAREANNGAARIAALRQLEEMRADEPVEDGFQGLYEVSNRAQAS